MVMITKQITTLERKNTVKMKKIIFLIILLCNLYNIAFSKGEISFVKQKERKKEESLQIKEKDNNKISEEVIIVSSESKEWKMRNYIVQQAKNQLEVPYVWGAEGNGAFDCSGFVKYVYKKANIITPRVANDMAKTYERVYRAKELKPGDLIFFETKEKGRISHTGMYIGNGQFIHASSAYKKVVISKLDGFYAEHFQGGANVIKNYI